MDAIAAAALLITALLAARPAAARLRLSRAKHPSLHGHVRLAKRLARLVPYYEFDDNRFFDSDGAPDAIVDTRRRAFFRLAEQLGGQSSGTIARGDAMSAGVSDLQ